MARAKVGYAAMLEQFGPQEVVGYSVEAEAAGFDGVMAADHFQPWVPAQGQAAFVWNVLTALGERTKGDIGPGVTCPSFRMHPALIAQASATLEAMYPGRFWLGLGFGLCPGRRLRRQRLRGCRRQNFGRRRQGQGHRQYRRYRRRRQQHTRCQLGRQ